ncbi:DUF3732 domain-containing protein [Halobacillus sp. A1]|uniref:DUF3732 domain-containing protein n=1 Tax=Halobacillus sp. A1 TaxID=2880262 RepID=UPI0020A62436|nr:DUF3732 domain-containing protein [Halobacillus sp. A1]MCP3032657.1 DUF3732 domain-containing protein [Halobacillus sp. A1]
MKFSIINILLWCENGTLRKLTFKENKVNVITGESGTGKTAIWSIIDYCLLNSENINIPEITIGENVTWYGIRIKLNGQIYTIARNSFLSKSKPASIFYLSGVGEIPDLPQDNIREKDLRKIIETEFSIDSDVRVPYGGKVIRKGSKVSFRYFLLFNTQTQNVIINDNVFFDKQSSTKYSEALERIFDLALTIDTIEGTLIREKINELHKNLNKLERKKEAHEKQHEVFHDEISELIRKAKYYSLIDDNISVYEDAIDQLRAIVKDVTKINQNTSDDSNQLEPLLDQRRLLKRKIRSLKNFISEYNEYKSVLGKTYESLLPIEYIKNNDIELLSDSISDNFINQLEGQLKDIKVKLKEKSPITIKTEAKIKEYKQELKGLESKIDIFNTEKHEEQKDYLKRYMLLGEIKTKLSLYDTTKLNEDFDSQIDVVNEEINILNRQISSRDEEVQVIISLLQELIQEYLDRSKVALENYAGYKAVFDYKNKVLKLREPNSSNIINTVGSSSNDLFLHISLFLGLHDLLLLRKSPFVPQFLFFDQPSRPYYDSKPEVEEPLEGTDKQKISIAFEVLNYFMRKIKERGESFQMIIVEHIPKEIWEDQNLENIYLVEEFRNGNKLINDVNKS